MAHFIAIIPARYASTRFPGKPLALLGGRTVIERVYRQVSEVVEDVFVATDDERIFREVERFGEFPWKNINDVPWLRGLGIGEAVREVFDSGKKSVREFVVEGERRVVVLSRTETDVFGRPAVIAVSSDTPAKDAN